MFLGGKFDDRELEAHINQLGSEGWELAVGFDTNKAYGETRDVVLVFKRPLSGTGSHAG